MQHQTHRQATSQHHGVTRTFIGQAFDPPYVFFGTVPLSKCDRQFIATGTIDHQQYLKEAAALAPELTRESREFTATTERSVDVVDMTMTDEDVEELVTPQRRRSPHTPSYGRPLDAPPTPVTPSPIRRRDRGTRSPCRVAVTPMSDVDDVDGQLQPDAQAVSWTAAEDRALWQAQLRFGEGKYWVGVATLVRQAGGSSKKIQDCRERWDQLKQASGL